MNSERGNSIFNISVCQLLVLQSNIEAPPITHHTPVLLGRHADDGLLVHAFLEALKHARLKSGRTAPTTLWLCVFLSGILHQKLVIVSVAFL